MSSQDRVDEEGLSDERRWRAVVERDRAFDGRFILGVVTTGVFCRPSCSARNPHRENVRFYPDAAEAERDGLRACLRCRPLDREEDAVVVRIEELCAFIREQADSGDKLTLAVLGRRIGLTPARLARLFRQIVGVTPRQYVEACRFAALKEELKRGDEVTGAIYQAGFGSSSRVYEQASDRLGMTPGEYRAGGAGLEISYAFAETPAGRLLIAATERGLCRVELGDSDEELLTALREEYPAALIEAMSSSGGEAFEAWVEALRRHLAGQGPHPDLPLDVQATAFRLSVWRYLQSIPAGETRSYSQVAASIGKPRAVRAVASACAANRLAIVIPCHRVIRTGGELGGYRWGKERKRRLLEHEGAAS